MYIVDNVFTYISCFGSVCVYEKESDELVTSLCDKLYSVLPNMILCRHLWPTILVAISAHTYVVDNFFTSNPLSFRKFWIILEQCVSVRRNLMSHQSWTCDKHVWQTVTKSKFKIQIQILIVIWLFWKILDYYGSLCVCEKESDESSVMNLWQARVTNGHNSDTIHTWWPCSMKEAA